MPAGVVATPSDMPTGQQKRGVASNVQVIPFARAAKWHIEQGNTVSGVVINSAAPGTINIPVPSFGYLSGLLLTVTASGGAGVAATYFEDSPYSAIAQIQLLDVNGTPIYQISGYNAFLAAKYGGYRPFGPDGSAFANTAPATNGNFKFTLPIWFEFGMDGLGCLPNMDASARYNCQLVLASGVASATGPLYTAAPTGYPTLGIQLEAICRSQPPAADMFGNANTVAPPAVGTIGYWSAQTATGLASGANTVQLTRVGNLIRTHILVWRNTNGTRATAETGDVPTVFEFDWDTGIRYQCNTASLRQLSYMSFGYDVPNGVVVLPNTLDPDKMPFSEYGDEWLPTVGQTKFTLRFSPTNANGSLTILTNDIVPASGQVYSAPSLQMQG